MQREDRAISPSPKIACLPPFFHGVLFRSGWRLITSPCSMSSCIIMFQGSSGFIYADFISWQILTYPIWPILVIGIFTQGCDFCGMVIWCDMFLLKVVQPNKQKIGVRSPPSNRFLRTNVASSGQLLSHLCLRVTSRIAPTDFSGFGGSGCRWMQTAGATWLSYFMWKHVKTANKHAAHTWHWDPFDALDSVEDVWNKSALHIAKMLMILSFLELELAYMEGGHAGLHECRL